LALLSGIGQQTALVFASEGAHVVCADINVEAAQRTVDLIAQDSANKKAIAVKADVGKEDQIKALVAEAVSQFGRLDVMLYALELLGDRRSISKPGADRLGSARCSNNAGIMHPEDDNALNTEERIWDLTMTSKLTGS